MDMAYMEGAQYEDFDFIKQLKAIRAVAESSLLETAKGMAMNESGQSAETSVTEHCGHILRSRTMVAKILQYLYTNSHRTPEVELPGFVFQLAFFCLSLPSLSMQYPTVYAVTRHAVPIDAVPQACSTH